jgi:glycerol-3-phosphate O-acyltransferase
VTATAVVSLALLGADRALTLDEMLATVRPLANYLSRQGWAVAGALDLSDRTTIRRTLQEMTSSHLIDAFDEGTEPVWQIARNRDLVAAFYRNTMVHTLVQRAITELALQAVVEDESVNVFDEAMRLRELLKFEFYFPSRARFGGEVLTELRLIGADAPDQSWRCGSAEAEELLAKSDLQVGHLVLRPYLDAYLVVADRLAAEPADSAAVDEERLLTDCLAVGQQWLLQHRIASGESVSLELFRTALRVADVRGLLAGDTDAAKRREFAAEVAADVRRTNAIGRLAWGGRP